MNGGFRGRGGEGRFGLRARKRSHQGFKTKGRMESQRFIFKDILPKETHKKEILNLFKGVGRIEDIYLPKKRNKEGKLFVFLRLKSRQEAEEVVVRKSVNSKK